MSNYWLGGGIRAPRLVFGLLMCFSNRAFRRTCSCCGSLLSDCLTTVKVARRGSLHLRHGNLVVCNINKFFLWGQTAVSTLVRRYYMSSSSSRPFVFAPFFLCFFFVYHSRVVVPPPRFVSSVSVRCSAGTASSDSSGVYFVRSLLKWIGACDIPCET